MSWPHVLWKMNRSANPVLILHKTFNYGIKFLQTWLKINHLFFVAHFRPCEFKKIMAIIFYQWISKISSYLLFNFFKCLLP